MALKSHFMAGFSKATRIVIGKMPRFNCLREGESEVKRVDI